MFKVKCRICRKRGYKANMERAYVPSTILGMRYRYYHKRCMESVIATPGDYSESKVLRALECYDWTRQTKREQLEDDREKERIEKIHKGRIHAAQYGLFGAPKWQKSE